MTTVKSSLRPLTQIPADGRPCLTPRTRCSASFHDTVETWMKHARCFRRCRTNGLASTTLWRWMPRVRVPGPRRKRGCVCRRFPLRRDHPLRVWKNPELRPAVGRRPRAPRSQPARQRLADRSPRQRWRPRRRRGCSSRHRCPPLRSAVAYWLLGGRHGCRSW